MLAAARPDRDQSPRGKFRPLSTPAADHRRALLPAFPLVPAFRGFDFGAVVAGVSPALLNILQPTRLPLQEPRQMPADQAAFADRLSAPGFVEAKFSGRPGHARCPTPGSSARWRVRCPESILTCRESPPACRAPAINRRSPGGDVAARSNCAAAAKSMRAVCVRPLVWPCDQAL